MKNTIIILIAIAAIYFAVFGNQNSTIVFDGQKYKIVTSATVNKNGFTKHHYTVSGRDTGRNDFIETFKFEKIVLTQKKADEFNHFIKNEVYKTKAINGTRGEFGIFGADKNQYAYRVRTETADAYWFVNYIIQSRSIATKEAKNNSLNTINKLETLLSELSD